MKSNSFPIPSLRNGLTVAFESIIYSRDEHGNVRVHGFTVTLGNTVTLGAAELHRAHVGIYASVFALAHDAADEMANARAISARMHREALLSDAYSVAGPN